MCEGTGTVERHFIKPINKFSGNVTGRTGRPKYKENILK
jgi:hypothetical protein